MSIRNLLRAYYVNKRYNRASDLEDFINWFQNNRENIQNARTAALTSRMGRILGRGGYSVKKFARDFRTIVPKSVRSQMESSAVEAMAGRGAYSGRGAYNNLVVGGRESMDISSPNDETQTFTISHCEYLQDVFGAPDSKFYLEAWQLNPGLVENFPWLAQIAANYEEYEFIQLLFHFKSTVDVNATNNNNGATGTLIMATNYNPSAPNFVNKESMMQYHGSNSGRLVEDHTHGVECDPEKNAGSAQKYVRSSPVVVNQDLKTYDLGKFQLAQVNTPSAFNNQQIGELWVTYTVKLTKPRLFTALGGNILEQRFLSTGSEGWNAPFGLPGGTSSTVRTGTNGADPPASLSDYKTFSYANMVTMQQGNIPMRVLGAYTNGSTTNIHVGYIMLYMPDYCTGVFEATVNTEGTALSAGSIEISTFGNVSLWTDIAGTNPAGDGWVNTYFIATSTQSIAVVRFGCSPITTGVDNVIVIGFKYAANAASPTPGMTQNSLVVRQVNPNLGQNAANPVPAFVNDFGTQVQV